MMEKNEEIKANAILSELVGQRNSALDRCVTMAGEIALLRAEIESLKQRLAEKVGAVQ